MLGPWNNKNVKFSAEFLSRNREMPWKSWVRFTSGTPRVLSLSVDARDIRNITSLFTQYKKNADKLQQYLISVSFSSIDSHGRRSSLYSSISGQQNRYKQKQTQMNKQEDNEIEPFGS